MNQRSRHRLLRAFLAALVLPVAGTVAVISHQPEVSALPLGSHPDIYLLGNRGSDIFQFEGDTPDAEEGPYPSGASWNEIESGSVTLPGTDTFSFDAGALEASAASDVWWDIKNLPCSATNCQLVPQNGARVVNLGQVGLLPPDQLPYLDYHTNPIPGNYLYLQGDV